MNTAPARQAELQRKTRETTIQIEVDLDGTGQAEIQTGLGFFDHMLTSFVRHSHLDLKLSCQGDLHIDDHHTIEDCGLALGGAIDQALGDRSGICRFGYAYAPLDESLVRAVLDLSGRGGGWIELPFRGRHLGVVATENLTHFFRSFAQALRGTMHVDAVRHENDHHLAEAAFKAAALALRQACQRDDSTEIPSTKGIL